MTSFQNAKEIIFSVVDIIPNCDMTTLIKECQKLNDNMFSQKEVISFLVDELIEEGELVEVFGEGLSKTLIVSDKGYKKYYDDES